MKILIAEDDLNSRTLLERFLAPFGPCDIAGDGEEAIASFEEAMANNEPYDLVCLDIMMPKMDGHTVLLHVREVEKSQGIESGEGVKVIMTTALDDVTNVIGAFQEGCEAYVVKPIDKTKLIGELRKLGFEENS
jgi:two-component system chemotaxis response regulator CheY